jgi:hypothetical protein
MYYFIHCVTAICFAVSHFVAVDRFLFEKHAGKVFAELGSAGVFARHCILA